MTSDHAGSDRTGGAPGAPGARSGDRTDAGPDETGPADVHETDPNEADPHEADLVDVGPAGDGDVSDAADDILARSAAQPGDPSVSGTAAAGSLGDLTISSEDAVAEAVDLAQRLERERDEYLDALRRLKADFENYKRRVSAQQAEQRAQGALELVRELLPVLDAFDAAVEHGSEEVRPLRTQLLSTLEKLGLAVLDETGVPFDPNVHEAVMHEQGEGEAVVAEVMRTGYLWNGAVVRAAMVKVKG